jgi:hypothetical protein
MIAAVFLILLGLYLACGLAFALPFIFFGVQKVDPHATQGTWGFRLFIIPGVMAFWPLLLSRWLTDRHGPPEEKNLHRCAARPISRS